MNDVESSNFDLNDITTALGNFAAPIVHAFAYGDSASSTSNSTANALRLQQERIAYNRLNGSGPSDSMGSIAGALGDNIRNFLFGSPEGKVASQTQPASSSGVVIAIAAGAALLFWLVLRR